MPEPVQPPTSICCIFGCLNSGQWQIFNDANHHDYTEACTDHVGALLGDAECYHVYHVYQTGTVDHPAHPKPIEKSL